MTWRSSVWSVCLYQFATALFLWDIPLQTWTVTCGDSSSLLKLLGSSGRGEFCGAEAAYLIPGGEEGARHYHLLYCDSVVLVLVLPMILIYFKMLTSALQVSMAAGGPPPFPRPPYMPYPMRGYRESFMGYLPPPPPWWFPRPRPVPLSPEFGMMIYPE